jgi:hypothetical protein
MLPDLDNVQGLIVRGYGMPSVSQVAFRTRQPGLARKRIGAVVDGPGDLDLRVTSGAEWQKGRKPEVAVNVGFTHEGLRALGLPEALLWSFPDDFVRGARPRVERLLGRKFNDLESGGQVLVSTHARSDKLRGDAVERFKRGFTADHAFEFVSERIGNQLEGETVHFGFRDGISQPNVKGFPVGKGPELPTGQFLLGYPSQWTKYCYPVPAPKALGHDGNLRSRSPRRCAAAGPMAAPWCRRRSRRVTRTPENGTISTTLATHPVFAARGARTSGG